METIVNLPVYALFIDGLLLVILGISIGYRIAEKTINNSIAGLKPERNL